MIICAAECGTAVQGHPRSLILVAVFIRLW